MVVPGLALGAALPARAQAARPAIEGLRLEHDDAGIRVSFRVTGAFDEDLLERVHSGVRLSFEHRVVLLGKRMAPLLPRVTLARTVVVTTVQYDSLTQRYDLERRTLAKSWPGTAAPPDRVEQRATESREEMESWMGEIASVPLPDPPERNEPHKIRVRTDLGMRFLLMFLPWPNTATAEVWLQPRAGPPPPQEPPPS